MRTLVLHWRFVKPEQLRSGLWVSVNVRFYGPSPVREVVRANDRELYMSEGYVKTLVWAQALDTR
jgi:hypothetical protein